MRDRDVIASACASSSAAECTPKSTRIGSRVSTYPHRSTRRSTPSRSIGQGRSRSSIRRRPRPCNMAMAWLQSTTTHRACCTPRRCQTSAPRTRPRKKQSRAKPPALPQCRGSCRTSNSSAWQSANSPQAQYTSPQATTMPPRSTSA